MFWSTDLDDFTGKSSCQGAYLLVQAVKRNHEGNRAGGWSGSRQSQAQETGKGDHLHRFGLTLSHAFF